MESFQIDDFAGRAYTINVEEVTSVSPEMVRTLIEIDLQTFAESTFSAYTASTFLQSGRVFLLRADEAIIGTCVCMRSWERPQEATILSMGIRPGWRGRGLGQRFISLVIDRLRSRGLRSVVLFVGADNRRAIRVYQDVGFCVVKEGRDEEAIGAIDALVTLRMPLVDADTEGQVIELPHT
ncbi:MAG: GNAT family N-acetyltransferase [Rhodobacterales bacterium]|nr:GNAT family N-acetyltransferase [Rhodobacterales bacterium]